MVFPPSVKPGDTVMLVSPSSPLVKDQPVEELARQVEALGFRVRVGASCHSSTARGYAAAPPEVRAADIHTGFADPSVRAVWCTRGGSTAWQLLPLLDYDLIRANPKPLIGFSDVTTLHLAVGQRCGLVTYHGPTANRVFGWGEGDGFSWPSLCRALGEWEELAVENPPGEPIVALRPGQAEGRLTGGNLSLVAASLGTPWQIDARDKILFLEDVGESASSAMPAFLTRPPGWSWGTSPGAATATGRTTAPVSWSGTFLGTTPSRYSQTFAPPMSPPWSPCPWGPGAG